MICALDDLSSKRWVKGKTNRWVKACLDQDWKNKTLGQGMP
jgi:hypothetical protein